jgi:hypothetical protein
MGTRSMRREEHMNWTGIALLLAISLVAIGALYLLSGSLRIDRYDANVAAPDLARYNTLAGIAAIRALDRDMGAAGAAEVRYAGLSGVAAVRALDTGWAVAQPLTGHLPSVAGVRSVDRAFGLAESSLKLSGVAAVRALDNMKSQSTQPRNLGDPHLSRQ